MALREDYSSANDAILASIPLNPEYTLGSRNAVQTCLAVKPDEIVALITDRQTLTIAASLWHELLAAGALVNVVVLEDYGRRPLQRMPFEVLQLVADSTVTIGCFHPAENEIGSRRDLINLIEEQRIRYAHMVWISDEIMRQGMRADYHVIDALSDRLLTYLQPAKSVTVRSAAGTDLRATFNPDWTWVKTSGLINPEYWSNLPAGEVFTTPYNANGVFVVDGTVGDYLCPKYGDLSHTPLTLEIRDNHLHDAHCVNDDLLRDFWNYCHGERNGDRIGEFAIGTNVAVSTMIGNLLQDEKAPGVHIAFGNPYGSQTGARWTCGSHIDAITRDCDVWADDRQIMVNGQFLV